MSHGRGRFLVGTSGWSYRSWHGDFYPEGVRQRDELRYLARHTTSSEINASFYRLQRPTSYRRWRSDVPDDHAFALKGSRYLTHLRQLREPRSGLANLLASGVLALGTKLEVLLWQLPATTRFNPEVLEPFLRALPRTAGEAAELAAEHDDRLSGDRVVTEAPDPKHRLRHALEPRHPDFAGSEAAALCAEHGVAMVHSDGAGAWPVLDRDTADFRYVRLHGHSELYASRYADRTLDAWADRCQGWAEAGQDVYVYFDNDARGHAPYDAVRLLQRLGARTPVAVP